MKLPFLYKDDQSAKWTLRRLHSFLEDARAQGYLERVLLVTDNPASSVLVPGETINQIKTYLFETKAHRASEWAYQTLASAHCPVRPDPPVPFPQPGGDPDPEPEPQAPKPEPKDPPSPPPPEDPDDPDDDDDALRRRLLADELRRIADRLVNPGRTRF